MIKTYKLYFKERTPPKCNILFRMDTKVGNEHAVALPASSAKLIKLKNSVDNPLDQYAVNFNIFLHSLI